MKKLILASSSPVRYRILKEAGFSFEVRASSVLEWEEESADPVQLSSKNAKKKAQSIFRLYPHSLVLGVDTVVFSRGKTLCKPKNFEDALRMFKSYCGQQYSVISAVALCYKEYCLCDHDETKMFLRSYSEEEYQELLPKMFSLEKSGGFGIEGLGSILLDQIEGSFYNVLGLPLHVFYRSLKKLPLNIWDFWSQ